LEKKKEEEEEEEAQEGDGEHSELSLFLLSFSRNFPEILILTANRSLHRFIIHIIFCSCSKEPTKMISWKGKLKKRMRGSQLEIGEGEGETGFWEDI